MESDRPLDGLIANSGSGAIFEASPSGGDAKSTFGAAGSSPLSFQLDLRTHVFKKIDLSFRRAAQQIRALGTGRTERDAELILVDEIGHQRCKIAVAGDDDCLIVFLDFIDRAKRQVHVNIAFGLSVCVAGNLLELKDEAGAL